MKARLWRWIGAWPSRAAVERVIAENREAQLREQAAAAERLARVGLDLAALEAEVQTIRRATVDEDAGGHVHPL